MFQNLSHGEHFAPSIEESTNKTLSFGSDMPPDEIMPDISVVICSHNPRPDHLRRTLDGLRAQTLSADRWQLILIDNASTEPLADNCDLSWSPGSFVVIESELGLTPARLRGIHESSAPLIVFVDDDNILSPDFLEQALAIARRLPQLGVFGAGKLDPEFERQPSPRMVPFLRRLALRSAPTEVWGNDLHNNDCCPYGAGLCVRREAATRYVELIGRIGVGAILDRKGQQLSSNGDDLFTWAAASLGQSFGVFPALRLTHLIAAGRVTPDYMVRLVRESRFSECLLYFLLGGERPRSSGLWMLVRVAKHLHKGFFDVRCRWAAARGEALAANYVADKQLQPIESETLRVRFPHTSSCHPAAPHHQESEPAVCRKM